jgi:micrococcal nuclease
MNEHYTVGINELFHLPKLAFLCIIVALLLAGCGTADNNGETLEETVQETEQQKETEQQTDEVVEEEQKTEENEAEPEENTASEEQTTKYDTVKTIPAAITKVVDGDTVKITLENGSEETVRLLLIDTPETVHPSKPVQPFGPEASEFAKNTLPSGKQIGIEIDVSERDKYGRLLAYIWVDNKMFNEMLLERGLARVAYIYPPNTKYVDQFRAIQRTAQEQGVGIWSIENYVQEDGYNEALQEKPKENSAAQNEQPSNSQSTNLKYDPNGPDRDCGDFDTQAEAQAFFKAAGGPAKDPHRLDGNDNDGIVCESLP